MRRKVSQGREIFEKVYKSPFGINVDQEKIVISGVALHDDIAESIFNMVDVGKSRMEDFRPNQLVSYTDKEKQL